MSARRPVIPNVGQRVLLRRPNPWAGCVGTVLRHETWMGRPAAVVELDGAASLHAGVLRATEWQPTEE